MIERFANGQGPLEAEDNEPVLVWPDLVYIELICMVALTALLLVWSIALEAPLEAEASTVITPNPSKAPWYFLGPPGNAALLRSLDGRRGVTQFDCLRALCDSLPGFQQAGEWLLHYQSTPIRLPDIPVRVPCVVDSVGVDRHFFSRSELEFLWVL